MRSACTAKSSKLTNNLKCWQLLIDLLETQFDANTASDANNKDNFFDQEVRDAYTRVLDLKIATPTLVLNYTSFLQEKCCLYEESFRVFERAIDMFPWPHKYEIWIQYLRVMVSRFQDKKIERVRELFSKCLRSLPDTRTADGTALASQKG